MVNLTGSLLEDGGADPGRELEPEEEEEEEKEDWAAAVGLGGRQKRQAAWMRSFLDDSGLKQLDVNRGVIFSMVSTTRPLTTRVS